MFPLEQAPVLHRVCRHSAFNRAGNLVLREYWGHVKIRGPMLTG